MISKLDQSNSKEPFKTALQYVGAGSAHLVPWFVSVNVAGFNLGAMPTLYKSQIIDKVSVACASCIRTKVVVFTQLPTPTKHLESLVQKRYI